MAGATKEAIYRDGAPCLNLLLITTHPGRERGQGRRVAPGVEIFPLPPIGAAGTAVTLGGNGKILPRTLDAAPGLGTLGNHEAVKVVVLGAKRDAPRSVPYFS